MPLRAPSDISNNIFLGNLNPDFTISFNNKFSYRNLSLSFQFDGRIGGVIYDEIYNDGMNGGTAIESASGDFGIARLAEWQTTSLGTVAPTPKYVAQGVTILSGTPIYSGGKVTNLKDLTFGPNTTASTVQNFISSGIARLNEYWMTSRSFIKLREVTLTYNISSKTIGRGKLFKAASISLVGRNLLYFAKRKDEDNDQFSSGYTSDGGGSANPGGQLQSVTTRRFGFNLNVSF